MLKFICKRVLMMIPVLLGVLFLVFTMNYISPGDPARMLAGDNASEETVEQIREEFGLNKSFIERFFDYTKRLVFHADLGTSYKTKRSVSSEIFDRLPTTIGLAMTSLLVGMLIALPIGVVSAIKQNTYLDNSLMVIALVGVSMPAFWEALMLIIIFAIKLKWLPSFGFSSFKHWILPAFTIGTGAAGALARITRSSMLEVIRQDFIRTARAKGQSERKVIWDHALKNSMIPIITAAGIQLGYMLGGAVLTETVFAIPGIGLFMVQAIKARDYPAVQGGVVILAILFCAMNLVVDIIYAYVDPRIKTLYQNKKKPKADSLV